jgi:hypothetical protein
MSFDFINLTGHSDLCKNMSMLIFHIKIPDQHNSVMTNVHINEDLNQIETRWSNIHYLLAQLIKASWSTSVSHF